MELNLDSSIIKKLLAIGTAIFVVGYSVKCTYYHWYLKKSKFYKESEKSSSPYDYTTETPDPPLDMLEI